ncbi:MAG TPA: TIR domain-containing protein [Methanoregulaceae archaeon]|nr:TIR domain-containing protein [Methanoregulaceae archaeon]HQP82459.1 TIR domain-containing protein [Methanoregulaceae archaeon]
MKLSPSSISQIALMICGENQYQGIFPYRSSSYLTAFFRDIDLPYEHHGESRRWWVQGILDSINGKTDSGIEYLPHPEFVKIIEHLLDPSEFKDPRNREKAIGLMNQILTGQGLSIYINELTGVAKLNRFKGESGLYDVALSFAGEDRGYVENVAKYLNKESISVFYDEFEKIDLWGKDLAIHLSLIYGERSKTVVIFISRYYYEKVYPRHEFQSALSKAIASQTEYILPARFDDTEIPGIRKTMAYVDLRELTPEQFAQIIIEKLRQMDYK